MASVISCGEFHALGHLGHFHGQQRRRPAQHDLAPNFDSKCTFDRATLLCAISPMMATRKPSSGFPVENCARVEQRLGGMLVRSIAGVDNGFRADILAGNAGAPEAAWRMTIASGRMATSVFRVSTSDSPLDTLDAVAVIEMVSAPSRFAAISKLVRVRVEASKNKLTTIRPRSRSSLRTPGAVRLEIARTIQYGLDLLRVKSSIPSSPCHRRWRAWL